MIIDCHTHISDGSISLEETEPSETEDVVQLRIVLGDYGSTSEPVNSELEQFLKKNSDKAIGFAYCDPTKDSLEQIKKINENEKFKGLVVYCSECGFHPAHTKAMQLYEKAEEMNLPVFFHNNYRLSQNAVLDFAQPYLLDEVSRNFPDLKIIIGSMGYPFVDQTIAMLAKHPNVYADLTINMKCIWQVYNTISKSYENGVIDKLLFGSGFPDGNPQECIETLLGFNKLFADTNLPNVPRGKMRNIIERDSLKLLEIAMES